MISQGHFPVRTGEPAGIVLAEGLEASTCPHPFLGAGDAGQLQVTEDGRRIGKGEGNNFFGGVADIEMQCDQPPYFVQGQVVQSVTRQAPDFVHVGRSEGGEGQDAAGLQEAVATGKESGRVVEPLQGGAGGQQVGSGGEVQLFGIACHETNQAVAGSLSSLGNQALDQ